MPGKIAKNGTASRAVVNGVFRFDMVETSEDLPHEVWEAIHREFPLTHVPGEVPTAGGSVVCGQPLPKAQWHILAQRIAQEFDQHFLFEPVV